MKILETERLILRPWRLSDADDMFEYARNPNVGPMAGWEPHASKEVSLNIIKSFIETNEVWAVVYKENNKVIGSLGIHPDKRRRNESSRSMGFVLSEEYWGRGLMTEAARLVIKHIFEEMKIELLSIVHYTVNNRSRRVIEKCGFKYEGILRQASTTYNGTVHDDVCYSMTKEEYYATR